MGDVSVEVTHEANPRDEDGGIGRKGHVGKVTEILPQVKLKAIVGSLTPNRGVTVVSFQNDIGDGEPVEACRGCYAGRASTYDHNRHFFHWRWRLLDFEFWVART